MSHRTRHPPLGEAGPARVISTVVATTSLVESASARRTTITLKLLMAVSGVVFIGFVLAHMYGNLKAFGGQASFNGYAEHLRELGEPLLPRTGLLWVLRAGLIGALVVHVACAVLLTRRVVNARSTRYHVRRYKASTLSSRTMRWGGVAILVFLIWHLLNFSIVRVNPAGGPTNDPYNLMVDTFELWWMTLIYLVAMAALAMHLRHGVWSAAQTLGLTNNAAARRNANIAGAVIATVVAGGFSLVPIFVLLGVIN